MLWHFCALACAWIKCQARSCTVAHLHAPSRAFANKTDKRCIHRCGSASHWRKRRKLIVHPAYTRYQVCWMQRRIVFMGIVSRGIIPWHAYMHYPEGAAVSPASLILHYCACNLRFFPFIVISFHKV